MLAWTCAVEGSGATSAPVVGSCFTCHKHLCGKHNDLPHRACKGMTHDEQVQLAAAQTRLELEALATHINSFDLAYEAEKARPGGLFKVKPIGPVDPSKLSRGGVNVHVPIEFEDGVKWYARFRQRRFDCPPPEIAWDIMLSEFWTMEALERGDVKAPKAYLGLSSRRGLFFFVEHIQGKACAAPMYTGLSPEHVDKLIASYAETSVKIASCSFKGIGSITRSADQPESGQTIGSFISLDFCSPSPPYFLGPFRTSQERYLASIGYTLSLSKTGMEKGDEGGEQMYLTHLWLRDLISGMEELGREEATYVKHADDKGDQVMVDEGMNVTGLIDWEWAYTAPLAEAFAAPLRLVDVNAFFDGKNELSPYKTKLAEAYEKLGRADLGDCVKKRQARLGMIIGQPPDFVHIQALQELVYGQKGDEKDLKEWLDGLKFTYSTKAD